MSKISELSDGGALQSTDYLIAVRSGGNVKVQLSELPSGIGAGGNIVFGDNDKAIFGAGSDLQIYHDGSSRIANTTGNLIISDTDGDIFIQAKAGENSIRANNDGTVQLYFDDALKFATTSTGIDVTGTVTADGLTVDGEAAVTAANNGKVTFRSASASDEIQMHVGTNNTGALNISTRTLAVDTDRLKIANNGDISFYEDTGSTPKFFWDASEERLGIGTSSPQNLLHVNKSDSLASAMQFTNSTTGTTSSDGVFLGLGSGEQGYFWNYEANDLILGTSNTERMRIDSSGNVGIGVTPENSSGTWRNLEQGGLNLVGRSAGGVDGMVGTNYVFKTDNSEVYKYTAGTSRLFFDANEIIFQQAASGTAGTAISWSEAMRIDSSGNLSVGTTATNLYSVTSGSGGISWNDGDESLSLAHDCASAFSPVYINKFNFVGGTSNDRYINWYSNGSSIASISYDGSTFTYGTPSDARLKTSIADSQQRAIDILSKIKVRQYDWIESGAHEPFGFIAQELEEHCRRAVIPPQEENEYYGIDEGKLVPILTKAIQEQQEIINDLRARVAQLEGA